MAARLWPPHLVGAAEHPVHPIAVLGLEARIDQATQQARTVDRAADDEVGYWHLRILLLPLNPALGDQQPSRHQRRPVRGGDVGVNHEVADAMLVLDGHEHDPSGRARTLAHQHQPRQPDRGTRA